MLYFYTVIFNYTTNRCCHTGSAIRQRSQLKLTLPVIKNNRGIIWMKTFKLWTMAALQPFFLWAESKPYYFSSPLRCWLFRSTFCWTNCVIIAACIYYWYAWRVRLPVSFLLSKYLKATAAAQKNYSTAPFFVYSAFVWCICLRSPLNI